MKKNEPTPEKAPSGQTQQSAQPAPPVTDQLAGLFKELTNSLAQLNERVSGLEQGLQAAYEPAPQPAPPPISDDAINEAIQRGENPAKVVRLLVQQELDQITRTQIEPLRNVGLGALNDLAKRAAVAEMPHYQRFQREIDAYVAQLDPALRARPETWKVAHDAVVGMHYQELAREAVEEALRKQREEAEAPPPGNTGAASPATEALTFERLVGPDAMALLQMRGLTPDEYARRLGYKDAAEFVEAAKTVEES